MNKEEMVKQLYMESFNDCFDVDRLISVYGDKLIDYAFSFKYWGMNSDTIIDCFCSHCNCAYGNYMNLQFIINYSLGFLTVL